MVSDGDSKSFECVKGIYGNDYLLEKLDCTGHVGRGMYKSLDNVRKGNKGKLSGGKFVGWTKMRLTGGAISRLSEFYRDEIRKNVNLQAMKVMLTKLQVLLK